MAKARHALETLNYSVEKVSLLQRADALAGLRGAGRGGTEDGAAAARRSTAIERLPRRRRQRASSCSTRSCATGLEPVLARVRHRGRRRHRDRRGEPLLGRRLRAGGERLQPPPDHARPAAHVLPRRAVALARPASACRAPRCVPLVNSSQQELGPGATASASSSPRAATAPGPDTLMVSRAAAAGASDARGDAGEARRSRIAVVGDSDFATNSFFHIMGNGTLFLNTVNYLAAQESLIGIQPRTADLPRVQPHQPADEGHVLPVRAPGPGAAGGGRHRGVVEAALSARRCRRRLRGRLAGSRGAGRRSSR